MSHYTDVVIETYYGRDTGSNSGVRARPLAGQGLNVSMNVECSSRMRKDHPVGTKFLVSAKVTDREGGTPFLYSHYNAPYRALSDKEAQNIIRRNSSSP